MREKGLAPAQVERAMVPGCTLRIGQRAALVPDPTSRVHGTVMSLTLAELARLYDEPSVRAYRPEPVLAHLAGGGPIAALCYNLPEPPTSAERNPVYAARLLAVARKLDLPTDYVSFLEGLAAR